MSANVQSSIKKTNKLLPLAVIIFLNLLLLFIFGSVVIYRHFTEPSDLPIAAIVPPPQATLPPPPTDPSNGGKPPESPADPSPVVSSPTPQMSVLVSPASPIKISTSVSSLIRSPSNQNKLLGSGASHGPVGPSFTDNMAAPGLFDQPGSESQNLIGNLYDFTTDQGGNAVKHRPYSDIVNAFVNNNWQPTAQDKFYRSPRKVSLHYLLIPVTPDEKAGEAFKSPQSSHAYWVVHYHGTVVAKASGRYRFLGFGDNVLFVRINDKIVLDASDKQYLKQNSQRLGIMNIFGPGKKFGTPIFGGTYFNIEEQKPFTFDILIGDEGGVTTSGLFIQRMGKDITFAANGAPKIPLFNLGQFSKGEVKVLSEYLPPECFESDNEFVSVDETAPNPSGF